MREHLEYKTIVRHEQSPRVYSHNDCLTGLRLLHELTVRRGKKHLIRLDFESANLTKGFDCFDDFLVDAGPGYMAHVGARNSSLNLGMFVGSGLRRLEMFSKCSY